MHRVPDILLIAMPAVCRKLGDENPEFREVIGRYSRGESIDVD